MASASVPAMRGTSDRRAEIPDIDRLIQLVLIGAQPLVRSATQSRRQRGRTVSEPKSFARRNGL
jgi:hypothetical protein